MAVNVLRATNENIFVKLVIYIISQNDSLDSRKGLCFVSSERNYFWGRVAMTVLDSQLCLRYDIFDNCKWVDTRWQ